jgi:hypothetical protein
MRICSSLLSSTRSPVPANGALNHYNSSEEEKKISDKRFTDDQISNASVDRQKNENNTAREYNPQVWTNILKIQMSQTNKHKARRTVSKLSSDLKMFGRRKLSNAHNSGKLFCSGVPVSKRRRGAVYDDISVVVSLLCWFFMRCPSSITRYLGNKKNLSLREKKETCLRRNGLYEGSTDDTMLAMYAFTQLFPSLDIRESE